jgi:hypothetical protein
MRIANAWKLLALSVATIPLMGESCTKDKVVELVIGFPSTVHLIAEGTINDKDGVFTDDVVQLKDELDVAGALEDAGIDVATLDADAIKLVQVFYRIIQPDAVANRAIESSTLHVQRVSGTGTPIGSPDVLVADFSAPAGSGNVADPEAWIDVTSLIGASGLALLNEYLSDCIRFLQGVPFPNPGVRFQWQGISTPTDQATLFEYEVKAVFQGTFPQEFKVPFGAAPARS